jgi:hypothetical protein
VLRCLAFSMLLLPLQQAKSATQTDEKPRSGKQQVMRRHPKLESLVRISFPVRFPVLRSAKRCCPGLGKVRVNISSAQSNHSIVTGISSKPAEHQSVL